MGWLESVSHTVILMFLADSYENQSDPNMHFMSLHYKIQTQWHVSMEKRLKLTVAVSR